MALSNRIQILIDSFLEVPTTDPDDARRRRLLNIILSFTGGIILIAILITVILSFTDIISSSEVLLILISSSVALLGSIIIYLINRYRSGILASSLFLLLVMAVVSLADTPEELSGGRSLYLFILPIIISSVLLGPRATFIFFGLCAIEIVFLAYLAGLEPIESSITLISFLLLTTIIWLASHTLEQTLNDLREVNLNLDTIVTERTHALAEALTRERIEAGRSQAILESIADGVIVFDTQKNAIQANRALSNLINVSIEDIISANYNDLVEASPMDSRNKEVFARLMNEPSMQIVSQRVEWGEKTISISSGHVQDRDKSIVGTVAVFRDFTKEAELERMKSTFVAMVSHELRTPLSAILGYAEIFAEQIYGVLNDKQFKMVNRMVTNSRRLLSLINDLLDQAQIEAGKLKIQYEVIRPSDLLDNLHSVMDKITSDKSLALTSELDDNMPETIVSDSVRLHQILVNLVNNAVKFTQEGSIHVQLSRLSQKEWSMVVSDTGKGIPKSEIPRIFDAFRQVEGTATRMHGGFGLGLSIVKQLVTLLGGSISVSSELGKGSTFSITFPIESKKQIKENI